MTFRVSKLTTVVLSLAYLLTPATYAAEQAITIEYVAHASFLITSPAGDRLLIDPYGDQIWIGYDFPAGMSSDAVLITHPHYDHDGGTSRGQAAPWPDAVRVLREPGDVSIGEIRISGVAGKHADPYGKEFGQTNTIWLLESAGIRIVHLGDNGPLSNDAAEELGDVDILMIPIDAEFHILKEQEIRDIVERLTPRIIIPMHYRIPELEWNDDDPSDLGDIDGWLQSRTNVRRLHSNKVSITAGALPERREVLVFDHWPTLQRPAREN
jgi:L-ascorbate metabolism protein UlaG (beta-lactamase superfamily)